MQLEDLIPVRVKWNPKFKDAEGKEIDLEFTFREFNLEDESWLKREFGEDKLQQIFQNLQLDEICRIAYRQLDIDSKKRLMEIKFHDIDEDGNEIEIAQKGPAKLGYLIQGGLPDHLHLVKMLLETRGVSMPMLDELGKKILEEKEKKAI